MPNEVARPNGPERGLTVREEFGASQEQRNAETAMVAVAARERAIVEAEYIVAARHPRKWMDVRVQMLDHCTRPRFAEVARYAKPIGKEKINGEWVEKKARGFSARFAETLAQEMGNVKPVAAVTYEDDLIRIVRIGVTDLERNLPRAREVTFARSVEKRGKLDKRTNVWSPPDGREVISQRINSYGEPTYLVRATEDEMRSKVNSEESKTQRDFILKLCPRDILEECEDKIQATLTAEDKKDPTLALKRLLDRFHEFGVMPSDLETYVGKPSKQWTEQDRTELRDLGAAIRDNQATFQEALRLRYDTAAPGEEESAAEHDARLQRQMKSQEEVAKQRIADLKKDTQGESSGTRGGEPELQPLHAAPSPDASEPTEEEMRQWERDQLEREQRQEPAVPPPARRRSGLLK